MEPVVGEETDCHDGPRRLFDLKHASPEIHDELFELTRYSLDFVNLINLV